jgi:NTE family protein
VGRLKLVAADVSTETKVIFPEMGDLYFENPENESPAVFARASMSIPYFFEPMRVSPLPVGPSAIDRWNEVGFDCRKEQGVPDEAIFIDGGIMSNFPIDAFHDPTSVPRMPTFGVKLQYDNRRKHIRGPGSLFGAIFDSARHCRDYDFIMRNPDFRKLVQRIPCQGVNWLNFAMPDREKTALFKEGALYAFKFLKAFDWQAYKQIRRQTAQES